MTKHQTNHPFYPSSPTPSTFSLLFHFTLVPIVADCDMQAHNMSFLLKNEIEIGAIENGFPQRIEDVTKLMSGKSAFINYNKRNTRKKNPEPKSCLKHGTFFEHDARFIFIIR